MRVLVLCGGKSAEREVSLMSASFVLKNLDRRKYDPFVAVIDAQGRWSLPANPRQAGLAWDSIDSRAPDAIEMDFKRGFGLALRKGRRLSRPDVVFPVLHGPLGEDGTVQGMLELAGLPYVGCGVLGSALGMDKDFAKQLVSADGIDILPYVVFRQQEDLTKHNIFRVIRSLRLPLFVKPARLGSSVGISKVMRTADVGKALNEAFRYDDKALVEKGIEAREIEVAVLGDELNAQASVCGEIRMKTGFYDYDAKYVDDDAAELLVPAPLERKIADKARDWAVRAFKALDGYGMARVDFLLDKKSGRLYFNELNTIPGFTSISLYPRMWEASGLPYPRLLDRLISLALTRHRRRQRLKTSK